MKSNLKIRILSALLAGMILFTGCGSTAELPEVETNSTENTEVTVEKEETNVVGTPSDDTEVVEEEEVVEEKPTAEELLQQEWQNYMMPDVKEYLNVRVEPSQEAGLAGKLKKGDRATVLEVGAEWTKIQSGNLVGYVSNQYCLFGLDALAYAKENCKTIATVTTDGLRMRQKMSTDSKIIKRLEEGDKLTVATSAETEEGWVAVRHNDTTYYVSAEYVTISLKVGTGMTIAEINEEARKEAEKKKQEEEQKRKEEEAKKAAAEKVKKDNAAVKEVDDVTLLAALIYCEAGAEPYEAQLAVGAVVMNRLESNRYPNSLYDVIYQKGQFTPARNGKVARIIAQKKATASCYKAAKAALAGEDNTDGCLRFNDYNGTQQGLRFGGMVFWNNGKGL